MQALKQGTIALLAGGVLLGGLLFGATLVGAQTPEATPAAEDAIQVPADSTRPAVTPETESTPADDTEAPAGEEKAGREGPCDKKGDRPDGDTSSRSSGAGQGGAAQF